jgi:hypothetical protein
MHCNLIYEEHVQIRELIGGFVAACAEMASGPVKSPMHTIMIGDMQPDVQ